MGELVLDGVEVRRGERVVLQGVSARLEAGERCAILGSNGAGKSTLLKCVAGVLSPARGEVRFGGVSAAGRGSGEALARERAYLAQAELPDFDFLVEEVVAMGEHAQRRGFGWGDGGERERVRGYLDEMGVAWAMGERVSRLSGGERQRVMMARVLATRARWWLLDEPVASLDMRHQGELFGVVRRHCEEGGGALVVLHDVNWAMESFDRVWVLHQGRLHAQGRPQEVVNEELFEEVFGVKAERVEQGGRVRWFHQREG